MLDLDPRVHLHEVELVFGPEEELHGPGVRVADGLGAPDRGLPHGPPDLGIDGRAGRLLDQLLVAALDRALPLAQVVHVAVPVGEDLDLHVARALDEPLQVDRRVVEGGVRLVPGHRERPLQVPGGGDDAHPLPSAARRRLDHQGVADLLGRLPRFLQVVHAPRGARDDRHAGVLHGAPGLRLVAHLPDLLRAGPDEDEPRPLADLGELGVLCQEAVAGMDGLGAGDLGRGDDPGDVEVALPARRVADAHVLVGEADVEGVAVGLGIDRHRPHAQLAAGADHPERDLAPVGDQDLAEHVFGRAPTLSRRRSGTAPGRTPPARRSARRSPGSRPPPRPRARS